MVGGQGQVLVNPASTLAPQDKAGRLRMLAVGSNGRVKGLNLPTVSESGLPGFQSEVGFGLFAPAGTPAQTISKLNSLTNRILKDPGFARILNDAGLEPLGGTAEEMNRLLQTDTIRWAEVVKTSGVKID